MKKCLWGLFIFLGASSVFAEESYTAAPNYNISEESENEFLKTNYDAKSYELAYQSFIYAGRVDDAFALVQQALKNDPNSKIWRERLVQTALWTNHPFDALQMMQEFILKENKTQYLKSAVTLSTQLKSYEVLENLLQYQYHHLGKTPELILNLANTYHFQGKTVEGIAFLTKENNEKPDKRYLKTQAEFLRDQHGFEEEKQVLKHQVRQYGWDAQIALRLAEIEYNSGRIQNAIQILNQVPEKIVLKNPDFWHVNGSLAWTVADLPTALNSYRKLYALDKLTEEDARRLYFLLQDSPNGELLRVANYRFQHFPSENTFFDVLDTASNLNNKNTIYHLYHAKLNPELKHTLLMNSQYYQGAANLWLELNDGYRAQQVMLNSLYFIPDPKIAAANYLAWITEQTSRVNAQPFPNAIENALKKPSWQLFAASDFAVLYPYAYGLLLTDRTSAAATLYSHYLMPVLPMSGKVSQISDIRSIKKFENITWNARYADTLERAGFNKSARNIRWYTWQSMQNQVAAHIHDENWMDIYRELALEFEPTRIGYPSVLYTAQQNFNGSSQDALMGWAINREQIILADEMAHRVYQIPVPLWAAARLAMWHEDLPMMRKLLNQYPNTLPRKEAVNMALELGARTEAQQHGYQALKQDHRDAERYEFFKEAFLPVANQAGITQEYLQNGNLQGFREKFHAKLFFKNRYYLSPYMTWWQIKTNASDELTDLNYNQKQMGLKIGELTKRYHWEVDAGQNQAYYNTPYFIADGDYQWLGQWQVGARASHNETSNLNNYMQIAGSQDQMQGRVQYQMTQRDTISSALSFNQYQLQNRTSLGKSIEFENNLDHKFWFSYPDYKVNINAGVHKFIHENKVLEGKITNLFPVDAEPNSNAFLPDTYWDVGASFGFGENFLEDYTQAWRPFATVGTNYQSTIGLGYNLLAGISGSVWGRDKLVFYYMQSKDTQGSAQKNYVYGIGYKIYF